MRRSLLALAGGVAVLGVVTQLTASAILNTRLEPARAEARVLGHYGGLPLSFEVNRGQTDARVKFLARGPGYTLFLTPSEAVLALRRPAPSAGGVSRRAKVGRGTVLRMRLTGENPHPRVIGQAQLPGKVNDLLGNDRRRWHVGIPTYAKVVYRDAYPGVDLVYYGRQGRLEYDFRVRPGADPGAVRLRLEGAETLRLTTHGDLLLGLPGGALRMQKPRIYQELGGARHTVAGGYVRKGAREFGFQLGAYDASRPLVIDPGLVYSTFLGGAGDDAGAGIALDATGDAYVTGYTLSSDFPTTAGAFDASYSTGDAFVAKLNPTGSALLYSTFLGGAGGEQGFGIALDSSGDAYVTGFTGSSDFPTTAGAFDTSYNSGVDAFVTKLDPTGSALLYSTFLGGAGGDEGFGIAVDSAGNAYVTGGTGASDFPITAGAFDTSQNGNIDPFVTKLNPTGSALLYSTFLGGSSGDQGYAIALDSAGDAYVTGYTLSSNFPATAGAFDTSQNGDIDAFVTKLDPTGSALLYATFLGGGGLDWGFGIAVDSAGDAYATGYTASTSPGFPTTAGAFDTSQNGGADAFVTKLNPTGSAPVYSTFLGGAGDDRGRSIALDSAGNAYVTGLTSSSDYPTTAGAFDTSQNGGADAFVTRLSPSGAALLYSTFLGGSGDDEANAVALDSAGDAYVTGLTSSSDFPTAAAAFDTSYNGGNDAFVSKLLTAVAGPTTLTLSPKAATNTVGATHCVTATVKDSLGNPLSNVTVVFSVPTAASTHASPASGSSTTVQNGQATFCYSASLPGQDAIHAFADANGNGQQNAGEPFDDATKTWTLPPSTAACEVTITQSGSIIADNGDLASFDGNAKVGADGLTVQGQQEYQDQGPAQPLNVHSIALTATTCSSDLQSAAIFGMATIDGSGTFVFRIDVIDRGQPGTNDAYGIILSNGYASGEHQLRGGNVTIHK